jgi:hypothetical protein
MSEFPISKVCPQCGSKEYTSRRPETFVAFASDRVCKVCLTRYSPPPPVWGGILFLLSGLALPFLGFVLISILFDLVGKNDLSNILGVAGGGACCIFALVVFFGGIRLFVTSLEERDW